MAIDKAPQSVLNGELVLSARGAWKIVENTAHLAEMAPRHRSGAGTISSDEPDIQDQAERVVHHSNNFSQSQEQLLDTLVKFMLSYPDETPL